MKTALPFIIKCNWVTRRGFASSYNVGVQWAGWKTKIRDNQDLNYDVGVAKQKVARLLNGGR